MQTQTTSMGAARTRASGGQLARMQETSEVDGYQCANSTWQWQLWQQHNSSNRNINEGRPVRMKVGEKQWQQQLQQWQLWPWTRMGVGEYNERWASNGSNSNGGSGHSSTSTCSYSCKCEQEWAGRVNVCMQRQPGGVSVNEGGQAITGVGALTVAAAVTARAGAATTSTPSLLFFWCI